MEHDPNGRTVTGLLERYGPVRPARLERPPAHRRPDHLVDTTLDALTRLSAALEGSEQQGSEQLGAQHG